MYTSTAEPTETITRTDRGLTITGTRITLYDVMDYYVANYPTSLIREKCCLTEAQAEAALSYIEAHKTEVKAEYQQVLKIAEENKQYWEKRNREHFSHLATQPAPPEQKAAYDKLSAWKDRLKTQA